MGSNKEIGDRRKACQKKLVGVEQIWGGRQIYLYMKGRSYAIQIQEEVFAALKKSVIRKGRG